MKTNIALTVVLILLCGKLQGATNYVSLSGLNIAPYNSWETAANEIQSVIDYSTPSTPGDTILVTNGIYDVGGHEIYGISNRVFLSKPILLQSVNGPKFTFIKGSGPAGDYAVRCLYVSNDAHINGFTLTGGFTHTNGLQNIECSGAGVYVNGLSEISNCIISNNTSQCFCIVPEVLFIILLLMMSLH